MSIHIVTDSPSDIPAAVLETLPITVVPVYITLNGKSYMDNIDLSRLEFYQSLPESNPHPKTAAPSPEQFIKVYDEIADKGATVIFSIHIDGTLSATIQSAQSAAKEYSRIPVHVIDSGALTLAEGLIVIKAAQAAQEGKTEEEVLALIESTIPRAYAYAKLDTIDYLLRGGRMSSIQHSVVSLLGIKPILKMNNHISKMEIARTKRKAFEKVLQTALTNFPKAEAIGITHANVPDQVESLLAGLAEKCPDLPEPYVCEVTPALGAHVGPGSLCVSWIASPSQVEPAKKGIKRFMP